MVDISAVEEAAAPNILAGESPKHPYLWRMDESLWQRLQAEAQHRGCDVKDLLNETMSAALDDHRAVTPPHHCQGSPP
jgi:hypothetical protein